jgi:hypothetical protein
MEFKSYVMMKYRAESSTPRCWVALYLSSIEKLTTLDFNEQYSYFYMLMARKI